MRSCVLLVCDIKYHDVLFLACRVIFFFLWRVFFSSYGPAMVNLKVIKPNYVEYNGSHWEVINKSEGSKGRTE